MSKKQKWGTFVATLCVLSILCAPAIWYSRIPLCAVQTPAIENDTRSITCSGSVISSQVSCVSVSMPIYVGETYVTEGSTVVKGQKLFDVDKKKLLALAAAGTDDNLDILSEDDYLSALSILAGGSTDKSVVWNTLPDAIYATDNGTVGSFTAQPGSILAANSTICTINQGDAYQLRLTVPEDQLGKFSVGNEVYFSPVAYPDREYYGVVSNRQATVRRQLTTTGYKNVADVFVTVTANDEYLADGMSVSATVALPTKTNILTVPYSAVGQDDDGEFVWVIKGGRATRCGIITGTELEDSIEVLSGLSLQDEILTNASSIEGEGELIRTK